MDPAHGAAFGLRTLRASLKHKMPEIGRVRQCGRRVGLIAARRFRDVDVRSLQMCPSAVRKTRRFEGSVGGIPGHPPADIEITTTPMKTVSAPAASRQVTCSSFWIMTLAIRMETSGEM